MAGYKSVLVAVDLTEHSDAVVRRGMEIARACGAKFSLLHVVEYIPVEPMGEALLPAVDIEDELARLGKQLQRELANLKRSEGKLGNSRFVDNAPEAVVAQERERLATHRANVSNLERQVGQMEALR